MSIENIKYGSHEEWLDIRRKYIGGSDAGAILGMNPYMSAYTLWAVKTGKQPEFEGNITTQTGAYLEEFVARLFEEETGKKVRKKNATMVNSKYPFACANVDRLVVGEKALLEIKTTTSLPTIKQLKGGDIYDSWYCQVTHYLAVTGLKKAYLAVLINCREFKVFEIERDQDEIDALMAKEAEFWQMVENDIPPLPDGSDSSTETINALYPTSVDNKVSVSLDDKLLGLYADLNQQIKALENAKKDVANQIKAQLGKNSFGGGQEFTCTWSSYVKKTFDVNKFVAEHPNMDLSKYYVKAQQRRFEVKGSK